MCRMCFKEMPLRSGVRLHCVKENVPRNYVDFRYPFYAEELEVIASGNEDRYNDEVALRDHKQ